VVIRDAVFLAVALSATSVATAVLAQQPEPIAIVGTLALGATHTHDSVYELMRKGLRELGDIEGRDFRIEHRTAEGHLDRLPGLAEELVRLRVAVIVTGTDAATRAAKQATNTIPIVAILPEHDPVASGLIDSFNQPGGNITGLTVLNSQLAGKRLQLLKEMLPGLSRVAVLWDFSVRAEVEELNTAAHPLHIQLQLVEMKPPYDFDVAFATARRQKAGAVMLLSSPEVYIRRARLGAMALEHKLPADAPFHDLARAGGLMSYSTDPSEGFYRSAYFIDRLLKGANPAALPFEQTANVRFIVNLKTSRALGLTIPQTVLLRADEVIR
jgi:putative ABC transport system substrate-binding protein